MPVLNPIGVETGAAYVITGPLGDRAVLNDDTDPDWVGFLSDPPTGLERADVRESADVLPEADGGVHGAFRYNRLAFTLQGIIPPTGPAGADTWQARQQKLLTATDAMSADAVLDWTPSEAPRVRLAFRQQQPTRISGKRPKTFIVAGIAEASSVESYLNTVVNIDLAPSLGGLASPLVSPLTSTAQPSAAATVTNIGRRPAWPVIRFYGPATGPLVIRNATLNRDLILDYSLNAGEYLAVSTAPNRRTVLLNGTVNRYGALRFASSKWWYLRPGPNDVRVGAQAFSAGAHVEVDYRHAWG